MSYAIKLSSSGDEDKMGTALALMHHQDPTFKYRVDSELKQGITTDNSTELTGDFIQNLVCMFS